MMRRFVVVVCLLLAGGVVARELSHRGMFVSSYRELRSGCFEFFDTVGAGGGSVYQPVEFIDVSLNEVFEFRGTAERARVRGRHLFYNNSVWDGKTSGLGDLDGEAIAKDKRALRPGGSANFSNYSSYVKGINGVMIDVSNLKKPESVTLSDLDLRVSKTTDFSQEAPDPAFFGVRRLRNGNYRISIIFEDGQIRNEWLRVSLFANERTGLRSDDVFYFGNSVGSADVSFFNGVGVGDVSRADDDAKAGEDVDVSSRSDFNRDGKVDTADVLIAFNSITGIEWNDSLRFSMTHIAKSFGLLERELMFESRESLPFLRVEDVALNPNDVRVRYLFLPSEDFYVELDEEDWELVFSKDITADEWMKLEDVPLFHACGKGWHIEKGDMPESLFFKARLKRESL
ncbi:hypothetical protein [Pelagicoccus mobilis]|uniref:EF-hand domain-containing protein n=1 Tax=Pelagicoccus mobilis TaxID=415221 RepID=A0A934VJK1_9BACT|nr:hypothetical protein [Pelagicoccus mobilis]MBK1875706.1 hypothetical protein [Pelagicoccus mobilis]